MRNIESDASYGDLIESFEVEVVVEVDENDYQGDSWYLLRDGHRCGFLNFGWGSCSGCDALEAAWGNLAEITELRDDLWASVHWEESMAAMARYLNDTDWSLQYSGRTPEFQQFLTEANAALSVEGSLRGPELTA